MNTVHRKYDRTEKVQNRMTTTPRNEAGPCLKNSHGRDLSPLSDMLKRRRNDVECGTSVNLPGTQGVKVYDESMTKWKHPFTCEYYCFSLLYMH